MPTPRTTWYKVVDCITTPGETEVIRKRAVNQPEGFSETLEEAQETFQSKVATPTHEETPDAEKTVPGTETPPTEEPLQTEDDAPSEEPVASDTPLEEEGLVIQEGTNLFSHPTVGGTPLYVESVILTKIGANYAQFVVWVFNTANVGAPPVDLEVFYQTAANKGGGNCVWRRGTGKDMIPPVRALVEKAIKNNQKALEDAMLKVRKNK